MSNLSGNSFRYIGRIIHLMRKEKGLRQAELAQLTGLKQPNLSRIENGLVAPRRSTLERIAKAMEVDSEVFFSEQKLQEVERKWAASMGPQHNTQTYASKMIAVPLFDISHGLPAKLGDHGELKAGLETLLQLPSFPPPYHSARYFAFRVQDNSLIAAQPVGIRPGDTLVFGSKPEACAGDIAYIVLHDGALIRKIEALEPDRAVLTGFTPATPPLSLPRESIVRWWKLVRHIREL